MTHFSFSWNKATLPLNAEEENRRLSKPKWILVLIKKLREEWRYAQIEARYSKGNYFPKKCVTIPWRVSHHLDNIPQASVAYTRTSISFGMNPLFRIMDRSPFSIVSILVSNMLTKRSDWVWKYWALFPEFQILNSRVAHCRTIACTAFLLTANICRNAYTSS